MERNTDEIIKLIDLFYDGETSLDQEHELYDYFTQENIADELQKDKETFLKLYSLNDPDDIEIPQGFDDRLDSLIDSLANDKKKSKLYLQWKQIGGIAASILIVLSIALSIYHDNHKNLLVDTYNTPEEAYEETERTLLLVSSKLNKGFIQWEKAGKSMSKVDKILNEKFN